MTAVELTSRTLEIARELGFDLCGIAPAADFPELANLNEWLGRGYSGEMRYLHDPRRKSPREAMPEARSIIICALNYNTNFPSSLEPHAPAADEGGPRGWISRYAWGDDYHDVLGAKLRSLISALRHETGQAFEARAYVDTGPIVERVAAKYAGIGWLGKNTCLIHEQLGSWLFLGVVITSLDLAPSIGPAEPPPPDLCGNCTLCLEACPTGALVEPYVLDARRCISYLTIELRGSIPLELRQEMGQHVFGCDICQDVCPWNRRAPATNAPEFQPRTMENHSLVSPELDWLLSLTEQQFREIFRGSPVKRAKWRGLLRNACIAAGNCGLRAGDAHYAGIYALLQQLAGSNDMLLSEHAAWALSRLQSASAANPQLPHPVVPPGPRR